MKRHPLLVPLSRDHHFLLVLGQVLRNDTPNYKGMPTTPAGKRAYALEQFRTRLAPHLEQEEKWLFPMAQTQGPPLEEMVLQLEAEHRAIRDRFELLESLPEEDLSSQLHELGLLLIQHVRFEERQFFELVQAENLLNQ